MAQATPHAIQVIPDREDPQLYSGLLSLVAHLDVSAHVEPDKVKAHDLSVAMARTIGLSDQDALVLLNEAKRAQTLSASQPAENGTTGIAQAKARLRNQMSPKGWAAVQNYVNGEYRCHTTVLKLSSPAL